MGAETPSWANQGLCNAPGFVLSTVPLASGTQRRCHFTDGETAAWRSLRKGDGTREAGLAFEYLHLNPSSATYNRVPLGR